MTNTIVRNNNSRKAGLIPVGCNGWFNRAEGVILHTGTRCPVCDGPPS